MKILFVDHVCHQKTKSADFFVEILRRQHEVREHYYSRFYHCEIATELIDWADLVVFWEFLPYRFSLGIPGKRCVFVPMYDNEWGSKWLWHRLAKAGMGVISFCRAVSRHACSCGVENLLEVQFAFDPSQFENMRGNPQVAMFWDRGVIDPDKVRSMFAPGALDRLAVYDKFVARDEYLEMIRDVGVYVAPRYSEGIGMSFLEPLAMGKCVIAHDAPTMNEYIRDGENGILTDMHCPRLISADELRRIHAKCASKARELYVRWQADQDRILEFFDRIAGLPPLGSPWSPWSVLAYLLYWLEGAKMRIFGK